MDELNRADEPTVLAPASFGALQLLANGADSGGSFVLAQEAPVSGIADAGRGWRVEVSAGSKVVVARGAGARSAEEAYMAGLNAAQTGLDLLSIRGSGDHLIRHAGEENLTWWTENARRVIRATATAALRVRVSVAVTVTDAAGKEKQPPAEPEPSWHPSFRYFRLAQVSDEAFDAYRNLYLALESILSHTTPKHPNEKERTWIERALSQAEASGFDLSGFAPPDSTDPVSAIVQDLYSETRTATFHAKSGQRTLLPLDAIDRRDVLETMSRLVRLYLALVERSLGVRHHGGGITRAGFDLGTRSGMGEIEIHVTDDLTPLEKSHTVINPVGGSVKTIATRPSPEFDEPFLATVIGETAVAELEGLTHIARIGTVREGVLCTGGDLEAPLTLGGFDVFQAVMGIRGVNARQPRSWFSA